MKSRALFYSFVLCFIRKYSPFSTVARLLLFLFESFSSSRSAFALIFPRSSCAFLSVLVYPAESPFPRPFFTFLLFLLLSPSPLFLFFVPPRRCLCRSWSLAHSPCLTHALPLSLATRRCRPTCYRCTSLYTILRTRVHVCQCGGAESTVDCRRGDYEKELRRNIRSEQVHEELRCCSVDFHASEREKKRRGIVLEPFFFSYSFSFAPLPFFFSLHAVCDWPKGTQANGAQPQEGKRRLCRSTCTEYHSLPQ